MLLQFGNNQTIVSQVDKIFDTLTKEQGAVSFSKPKLKLESRDCFVYRIQDEHIHQHINTLLGCKQSSIHVMEYGVNQHFQSWHKDNSGKIHDRRKVSMSLLLNNDFQGGELQFETQSANLVDVGDYVIFDSNLKHRVTKVTRGTRKTLVCWGYA